ncbi:WXG100 family type VII secretion target [Actinoallomurus soli]|uniref:WXG100 family type VII secretion target n=1 Tax=Actinoallomurus soli TaxID=2952535 RepID=UPI002093F42C|nr:WXG100 family type VII secretion target [Actinoallomurus soli]MCO5968916.1 WXG100 family type VII secretion target [Actinoallomurus soli]
MSDRIRAELAALAAGERAFAEVLKSLRKTLADLERDLSSDLDSWDGDARLAYEHSREAWRAAADDMAHRLDGLKKVIGVAHRNYGRSLSANVRMWRGA